MELHVKVVVCGGREFNDKGFIFSELDRLHRDFRFSQVIEGAARGVDTIAGAWARARGLELVEFPADWKNEGRHAALSRNELGSSPQMRILESCDGDDWLVLRRNK